MNKPPDIYLRDSHKMLSFLSCQTNADDVVVAVFGTDDGTSNFLKEKFLFFDKQEKGSDKQPTHNKDVDYSHAIFLVHVILLTLLHCMLSYQQDKLN
jgi:hypothetical protein